MINTHWAGLLLMVVALSAPGQPVEIVRPFIADRAGGAYCIFPEITYIPTYWSDCEGLDYAPVTTAYFGGVPFPRGGWEIFEYGNGGESDCVFIYQLEGEAPPYPAAGLVDVEIEYDYRPIGGVTSDVYPAAFLYVDAPVVETLQPNNHSIGPDNRRLRLEGAGFPLQRGVEVWIGDQQATDVVNDPDWGLSERPGTVLTCAPPPFPGGDWPLTVDVRVVTVGGGVTVLPDAYTYTPIIPVIEALAQVPQFGL